MLSRNQIKEIRSLKQKKFRQKYDKFIVEGHKTAIEFLKSKAFDIDVICASDEWIKKYQSFIAPLQVKVIPVASKEMERISLLTTPTDVLLVCNKRVQSVNLELNELKVSFYLDDIQDPGNLGTLIRISDWFGWNQLFLSENTVDEYNPKVIQASRGSICNIDIHRIDLIELKRTTGCQIIGTSMKGNNINQHQWKYPSTIILGNEGHGISPALNALIDEYIAIPGDHNKVAESLNVASAASIIAYAATKGL